MYECRYKLNVHVNAHGKLFSSELHKETTHKMKKEKKDLLQHDSQCLNFEPSLNYVTVIKTIQSDNDAGTFLHGDRNGSRE